MTCAHDCRYFITIDSNPKKTITCDVPISTVFETTRQAGLVKCSQYGLSTSPYESKLASG